MNSQPGQTPFFYNLPAHDLRGADLLHLRHLLIVCQKLGIPIVTKSLAFYLFHRSNALKAPSETLHKPAQIMACISLAMKMNEHVKKFKEVSNILLEILNIADMDLSVLKDEMMVWELMLQEDIYFIQEWDSPFRFLLKIVFDLGGDERLAKRAWKITCESYFCNICIQAVPQAIAFAAIYLAWRLEHLEKPLIKLSQVMVDKYFCDINQVKNVCIHILMLYQQTDFLNSDDKMRCHLILEEMQSKSRQSSSDKRSESSHVDKWKSWDNYQVDKKYNKYGGIRRGDYDRGRRHSPEKYRDEKRSVRTLDHQRSYSPERHYSESRRHKDSYDTSRDHERREKSRRNHSSSSAETYQSEDDHKESRGHSSNRDRHRSPDDRDEYQRRFSRPDSSRYDSRRKDDSSRYPKYHNQRRDSGGYSYHQSSYQKRT